ncbi:winged helix-turn-helix domain-containing protein [Flavisphingomonas formosensis]|uniref:winged helix-turn-helix domain-containing protein n=1 Tax=Flavisphingomonas formosensis TaxID=861534 RepID=UPI0012F73A5A|nr:winged helix-turn-helix domain-containing protein [Sphingomonas formosensis]
MASRASAGEGIILAHEPQFSIGTVEIWPSLLEIRSVDERITIEPRVMQVLTLLAGAGGRTVSREELVARCWAGRAVGEDAINRVMSRIRKLAALDDGRSFALETVPRVGYRLREIRGSPAPVAPIAADERIDIEVRSITAARRPDRRTMLLALGAAAGVAACGGAFWWTRPAAAARARIAVLPFDVDRPDQRVIADGLADALIGALVGVAEIDVVARSSTFALRGARKAEAAKLLGASHLIDGAVSELGGAETVTLDLIDAASETTLWSRQYPVASETLSLLRARVARDTAAIMRQSLVEGPAGGTIDPVSYRLFLQGRGLLLQDPPQPGEAIPVLKQALARAADYSAGWTLLGTAQLMTQARLDPDLPVPPGRAAAREAARQAIRADARNADAYALLAAATDRSGQWQAVERLLVRALELGPSSPDALYRAGTFYADVGRNDRAIELLQRAWNLDPLNADAAFLLLRVLEAAGREEELESFLAKVRMQWRDDLGIWRFAICRAVSLRRLDEAQALIADPSAEAGAAVAYFADLLACMRDPASPRIATFLAPLEGPLPLFWPISVFALAMIGRREACLALIRRIFLSPVGRAEAPTWVLLQTMVRPLWTEPALQAVLRELGLFDFWRVRGGNPLSAAGI